MLYWNTGIMSSDEVTGKTVQEIHSWKRSWDKETPFEEAICLKEIPRQPDDYDGPSRYCSQYSKNWGFCHYHGGAEGSGTSPTVENLDKFAAMTHGLTATRENFYEYISEGASNTDQQAQWMVEMYDWIVDEWPQVYDIDLEEDPASRYDFHALAVEIVRAEHAEGYILREGEKATKEVVDPSTGEILEQDIPHYLGEMMQRQRKLIMRMEDHLGISRKSRLKREDAGDATDAIKDLAEVGKALLSPDEHEYDSEEFA